MKGEAASYLARAEERLRDARAAEAVGMPRVAVREAYLAVFHAAQAVIFESRQQVAKTHSGARTLFAVVVAEWPTIPADATRFLAHGFRDKTIADYGSVEETAEIGPLQANTAVSQAVVLVAAITQALTSSAPKD